MVREVQLANQCGNLHKIEAIETTEVCAPLVQPKINTDNLPQELKLATIPFGTVKIEILIGLDNYYKFLGDQLIRLNENLVAHNSIWSHSEWCSWNIKRQGCSLASAICKVIL